MKELNLIRKIAWSFHKTTNIEWDELFQEACLAYAEALHSYNPKRGKLSTYIWYCIHSHLINLIRKWNKTWVKIVSIEDVDYDIAIHYQRFAEELSEEALAIAKLILNNPCKYSNLTKIEAKREIIDEMRENNHTMKQVYIGFKDLKNAFK